MIWHQFQFVLHASRQVFKFKGIAFHIQYTFFLSFHFVRTTSSQDSACSMKISSLVLRTVSTFIKLFITFDVRHDRQFNTLTFQFFPMQWDIFAKQPEHSMQLRSYAHNSHICIATYFLWGIWFKRNENYLKINAVLLVKTFE